MGRSSYAKEKILETATQLFWQNGYETSSMAELLEKSGVKSGSFYHFFSSKDDLLLSVLDGYLSKFDVQIRNPAFQASRDPIERIFCVFNVYRRLLVNTNFSLGCPIGNIVLEVGNKSPEVRKKTDLLFDAWRKMIQECLVAARDQLANDCSDLDAIATFVLTVMEGAIVQARCHRDIGRFDISVRELRRYFDGISVGSRKVRRNNYRTVNMKRRVK